MTAQMSPETLSPRQKTLALLTLVVAVVLEIVDLTIVNTALPAIKADLGAGAEAAQWVVAGYALSFALLLMAGGRLGDSFGYRRIFLVGVAGFTLASLACGLATSPGQLVAARLAQGAAGAIMAPQAMALMQVLFDPLERVAKLALFGLIGGLAAIAGPVLGGLLIEANLLGLGWRLVFLINLPLGLLALAAGWRFLPAARSGRPAGFDLPGMALFAAAVLALLWPLTRAEAGWSMREWLCLALAVPLAAWGWRHVAARVAAGRAALFDPALLAVPAFAPGLALSIAFAAANAGFLLAFAFALQSERGESALVTGLLHMPFGLGAMVGIAVLGRTFLPRYGRWVLVAGGLTMALAAAAVLIGIGRLALTWLQLTPLLVLAGLGMGALSGCINPVALARIDRDHAGAASALLRTSQQLGSALGVALAGSVYFAWRGGAATPPSLAAAVVVAALLVLCAGLAVRLPDRIFAGMERQAA
jgi:EmrB/QacA subfamily drug resistance transporter